MRKIGVLIICLFSCICWAQAPEVLLNTKNPKITGKTISHTFDGTPAILIEKPATDPIINSSDAASSPDLNVEFNIPIQTPLGHDRTAAWTNQATDFISWIQILDNQTALVTEQIQLINTLDETPFRRTFANSFQDKSGQKIIPNIQILSLKENAVPVAWRQEQTDTELTLTGDRPLTKGVHNFTIQYLVSDVFKNAHSVSEMTLPLTGMKWPWITERLTAVVFMPKKTATYAQTLLFGSNNQDIPDQVRISQDSQGTLIFQTTRPIPAYADVRIHLMSDATAIPVRPQEIPVLFWLEGSYLLVMAGYVAMSILGCRFKQWKRPLTKGRKTNPFLWGVFLGYALTDTDKEILSKAGIKSFWYRFSQHPIGIKIASFFRFNIEYILGISLLLLVMRLTASYWNAPLPIWLISLNIGISLIALLTIHRFGTHTEWCRLKGVIQDILLQKDQGLNLPQRDIAPYFITATCLGFGGLWATRLAKHRPSHQQAPFLAQREK